MLFGSMFEEHANSSRTGEENEVERMRREILKNLREAQEYAQQDAVNQVQYALDDNGHLITPEYDDAVDYYKQFWKLFLSNQVGLSELKQVSSRTQAFKQKVATIERLEETYFSTMKLRNKKKHRRPAVEIQKSHTCPYENCYKNYGSDVSLNLHIKIKHNGGNKTDREKLAVILEVTKQQICLFQAGKGQKPHISIQFPPGFMDSYRAEFSKKVNKSISL